MSSEVEMQSTAQRHQAQTLNDLHDAEESSLLGNNGNGQNPFKDDAASSSLDRLARPLPLSNPSSSHRSLSKDFGICKSAWGRLSWPTRSILLFVGGVLLVFAAYEFGMDEGVREQEKENDAKHTADYWKTWRVFGDGDDGDGDGKNDDTAKASNNGEDATVEQKQEKPPKEPESEKEEGAFHRIFTKEHLINTRARAQALISELDEYYGGEEKARAMLVNSWQAQWQLDEDYLFLDGNEDENDDDDDDDDDDIADDDGGDNEERRLNKRDENKKRKKEKKENKAKNKSDDDDDDKNKNKQKKNKKKKGPKEGNVIDDPENMSQEELEQHHHYRRQRSTKLVTTMARALLNPDQDRFIIGTIGSSVAAGHDNCHYDSYESQLERTLGPVFSAANMFAIVQNAGEGGGCGDNHQNQVFCITHNVSPDVDIIHYSWTYFEKETPEVQREQLVRWAQNMERRPMVHHLVARGKKNTCEGDTQANVDLDKAYAMYGYNAFCIQTGLYFGGHDYDTEMEEGVNRFGWQHHGDGYHNTTRYGEELQDDDPRKASLGTVYRNWHPGPLGFQVASDAFAYVYTTGLLMALDIIEEDMNADVDLLDRWFDIDRRLDSAREKENGNDARKLRSFSSSPSEPSMHRQLHVSLPPLGNMPEPLFCDPLYCSIPHPPSCINYEKPTFGSPGITVQSAAGWKIFNDPFKWNKMVGKVDIAWIKELHDKEWEQKCAHLDACGGIHASDSSQGKLTFELPSSKMTAGLVFVCGCCGKNIAESMFLQNQNVTFKLNDRVLDKSKMDVYPNSKCVRLLKHFGENGYEKEDTMLLSLEMADQDPDMAYELKPHVEVSHVVAL